VLSLAWSCPCCVTLVGSRRFCHASEEVIRKGDNCLDLGDSRGSAVAGRLVISHLLASQAELRS